ncbi:unnamed protein product [Lymnaea stagnalis]|uniref:Ig-like domain-containing protein n=1 Tax=Lymnaea stagnalis TaxID=6523 RepID=A0AAV2H0M5_LYMST
MSEVKEIKVIQSEIQHLTRSTYRLAVDYGCHDRESLDLNLDICNKTTKMQMAEVHINLRKENFLHQKNISVCSCSISSTSDLTVLALDVRLKDSNRLKLSPEKGILRQTELYWLLDGNLIPDSQEVNITVSGLEASIPDSLWLKVTGTNMTIICQTDFLIQQKIRDDKIDMMLIIIIAVVSAVVTISAIILICCICKYKRQKQNEDMCKSPTTTPLVLGQVHKDHDEVVYSEPGKPVPARHYSPKQNYFELENTYEEPTNPHKSSMNDHEDFSAEDSVYNHLREQPDLLPSNIYNTTAKSEYSSFKRNAAGRQVIDNDYDI